MAIQIKVNDKVILASDSHEATRQAISQVLVTKNPFTDGITESLASIPNGSEAFYSQLIAAGTPGDLFTVEEKPQGKTQWEFAASATREVLGKLLNLAMHKEDYKVNRPSKTGKEKSEKVAQVPVTADDLA